jgi:hypothetical protein
MAFTRRLSSAARVASTLKRLCAEADEDQHEQQNANYETVPNEGGHRVALQISKQEGDAQEARNRGR